MVNTQIKQKKLSLSKEIAYIATTCALLLGGQFVFSFVAGVEVVTIILVCFSFVFGAKRGIICAVCFSLLRCIIYGFYPTVVLLYLIYYPLLTLTFGLLGKCTFFATAHSAKREILKVIALTAIGMAITSLFTILDDVITPLFYGLSQSEALAYFTASVAVIIPQIICTAVCISTLFLPLTAVFQKALKI